MQNKIYEYFSQTHGQVKDKQINEYENWTKKPTKKASQIIEISKSEAKLSSTKIMDIFWKGIWAAKWKIKSTFNETDCKQYFRKILSEKNRHKTFKPLLWMKKLDEPTINFHLETPLYAEITKIIVRMKSSASPCPCDAISIIAIKKCPILRSTVSAFNILER